MKKGIEIKIPFHILDTQITAITVFFTQTAKPMKKKFIILLKYVNFPFKNKE